MEPSAGEGAFLVPMATRLLASCRSQRRPWLDCLDSLQADNFDATAMQQCRRKLATNATPTIVTQPAPDLIVGCWRGW